MYYTKHCKSAYTGLDESGSRKTLKKIPGLELIEMPRHGKQTVCCGSWASAWFPEAASSMRNSRLQEAEDTKADEFNHCMSLL